MKNKSFILGLLIFSLILFSTNFSYAQSTVENRDQQGAGLLSEKADIAMIIGGVAAFVSGRAMGRQVFIFDEMMNFGIYKMLSEPERGLQQSLRMRYAAGRIPFERGELIAVSALKKIDNLKVNLPLRSKMVSFLRRGVMWGEVALLLGGPVVSVLGALDLALNVFVSEADAAELTFEDRLDWMMGSLEAYAATSNDKRLQQDVIQSVGEFLPALIREKENEKAAILGVFDESFSGSVRQKADVRELIDVVHNAYDEVLDFLRFSQSILDQLIANPENVLLNQQFLESWGEMNEAQYRDILGEDYESRLKLVTIKYGNYSRAHKVLLDIIDKAGSSIASERERALGDIESVLNWASQTFVDISVGRNGLTPRGIQIVEFLSEETSLEVLSLSLINQLNNTLNLAVGSENMWLRGRLTHERFDVRIFKRRHFQTN